MNTKQIHTILIVDDELTSILMLERVLRPAYNVVTARSGEEAVTILKDQEISLLITDQRMPGMTGSELLRHGQTLRPGMVSLMLTSSRDTETLIEAMMKSGAIRVLTKPFEPAELLSAVETSLKMFETNVERKKSMDRLKQTTQDLEKIANRL